MIDELFDEPEEKELSATEDMPVEKDQEMQSPPPIDSTVEWETNAPGMYINWNWTPENSCGYVGYYFGDDHPYHAKILAFAE